MPPKTLPSFALVISSRRESFALPDYYRRTRVEEYGPFYRESAPEQDLMKTIDLRGRDSPEYSHTFPLPDIFEDDEIELEIKSEHGEINSTYPNHIENAEEARNKKHSKRLRWFWRLFLSLLRKCRGHKVHTVKNLGTTVEFDLTE